MTETDRAETDMAEAGADLLRAESITKRYGGTLALDGVDFAVAAGEVHVLIGENGAGKSTLMRILAGVERPMAGSLLLDGQPVRLAGVRDAAARGIGMVHQELNLCPNLTVAENIFVAQEGLLLDRRAEHARAQALMARLGRRIDPQALVESLSIGDQQIVEIAKALAEDCRVLIFDEPTSALSAAEVDTLFAVIGDLKAAGVGVVYISHRLEELLRVGDRITVMRGGRIIESRPVGAASVDWIIATMLGPQGQLAGGPAAPPGPPVLELRGAVNASFHAGEVTAIYGLLGSGRTELLESLFGARGGDPVWLDGQDLSGMDMPRRVRAGLLFVPEDRKRDGLFANFSVAENLSLTDLPRLSQKGVLARAAERLAVSAMIQRLGIKTASSDAAIGSLSGGNQQKVLIGRALMPGPRVLLLDEPGRGIDVGARAELFEGIRTLAAQGLAVIFASSDLLEVMNVADRVMVLAQGQVTLDAPISAVNERQVVAAANRPAPLALEA